MKKKTMFAYLRNLILVVGLYAILMVLMDTGVIDRYYAGILTMMFINMRLEREKQWNFAY